ncbi:MAG: hypothetical protein KF878_35590 [Planctomycetes bacterium]|nr:hypothetical protein [Planctomycetota bacterium]
MSRPPGRADPRVVVGCAIGMAVCAAGLLLIAAVVTARPGLLGVAVVLLVFALPAGLIAALERETFARPPAEMDPPAALDAFARRLTGDVLHATQGGWSLTGRLDGERLTVQAWEGEGVTLRLEAQVPVALTGTIVSGFHRTAMSDGGPPHAPLRSEAVDAALRVLLAAGGDVEIGLLGLEVRVPPGRREVDLEPLARALITVAGAVRSDAPPPPDPPQARVVATRTRPSDAALRVRRTEQVCPYCRGGLDEAQDEVVACAACGTLHHAACFAEHRRCTVRGCERRRAEPVRRR